MPNISVNVILEPKNLTWAEEIGPLKLNREVNRMIGEHLQRSGITEPLTDAAIPDVASLQEQINVIIDAVDSLSKKVDEQREDLDNFGATLTAVDGQLGNVPLDELSEISMSGLFELVELLPQLKDLLEKFPVLEETVEVLAESIEQD